VIFLVFFFSFITADNRGVGIYVLWYVLCYVFRPFGFFSLSFLFLGFVARFFFSFQLSFFLVVIGGCPLLGDRDLHMLTGSLRAL